MFVEGTVRGGVNQSHLPGPIRAVGLDNNNKQTNKTRKLDNIGLVLQRNTLTK